jgi:hypothetical protein
MKSFFDTDLCVNERNCPGCRSLAAPAPRHTVAQRHGLDPDFPCPKGYPLGATAAEIETIRAARRPAPAQVTVTRKQAAPRPSKPPPPPPEPSPADQWPWYVTSLAALRQPDEAGVGDTLYNQLHVGGKNAIGWALKLLRIPCGCASRQKWLNARYPYIG